MHQQANQLMELLSNPDLSLPELFESPDILPKIKAKLQLFVDFLLRNPQFTKQMIGLGIKAPMHKNEGMKKIAYVASDILTCDHDVIANLFVVSKQRVRYYSEDDEFVCQDIVTNQQTGELQIADKKDDEHNSQDEAFNKKYFYLIDMLDYLQQKERDENCVNYLSKALNTVIRVKPQEVFQFFREKGKTLDTAIRLAGQYPSLALTLVKLVQQFEDKNFRDDKISIVDKLIGYMKASIEDRQRTANFVEFVEEIFNKNKYRSQEIDQIKIISQPLVDQGVIDWMLATLKDAYAKGNIDTASNCILYLLKVVDRMNVDDEDDPYSYTQNEDKTPTMDFQVSKLMADFQAFLLMCCGIVHNNYSKTTIVEYLDLLIGMMKNNRFKAVQFNSLECLTALLKSYQGEAAKGSGIIKNRLVSLIQRVLSTASEQNFTSETLALIQAVSQKQQSSAQSKCFNEKLQILLLNSKSKISQNIKDVYVKYRGLLEPTDYIEKKGKQIDELKFAHQNKYLEQDFQKSQIQNKDPSMILGELDLSLNSDGHIKNKQPQEEIEEDSLSGAKTMKKSLNFNLKEALDKKIQMVKAKKVSQQQNHINERQQVGEDPPKQGNEPLKKQHIEYYIKHLLLF